MQNRNKYTLSTITPRLIREASPALPYITQETAKILHRDIFCFFFLRDGEFVSKMINDSNIDLNKLPACEVRQLAKKMESFEAIAKHIKEVASDPQAAQIHLMCHQCTELPPSKFQRKQKKHLKSREDTNKQYSHEDDHKQYYNQEKTKKVKSLYEM